MLGLRGWFESFSESFNLDGFFFVDPNADSPDLDDRPPRDWVQDFLDKVREG